MAATFVLPASRNAELPDCRPLRLQGKDARAKRCVMKAFPAREVQRCYDGLVESTPPLADMNKKNIIEENLCRLTKKDMEENMPAIVAVVSQPKFICQKCARVSSKKKLLCKPEKLPSP